MESFTGGIHLDYNKITANKKIEVAKAPKKIVIPLQQHTGAPCKALVNVGDTVKVGQKIGESEIFVSASVHASISGTIKAIEKRPHPTGLEIPSIIIESDGRIEWHESVKPRDNIDRLEGREIIGIIKEAGIVGLGGAAFPTHVKLKAPEGTRIWSIILNGAECEPYLTCDHRLMLEQQEKIIRGLQLAMKAVNAKKGYIGIEDNKENAIGFMKNKVNELNIDNIEVRSLKTKYPQGAEKMLVYTIKKAKVPCGGLPLDVGTCVLNVQTAKAIYDAVHDGKPLVERVITVAGAVKEPKNLLVRIGASFKDCIEQCGGYLAEPKKIIAGGPMTGVAQYTDEVPIVKGTSGILVLDKVEEFAEGECIRCSRCVDKCPMLLIPTAIAKFAKADDIDNAEKYFAMDCFECGICSYICPSRIPLVQYIRYAKSEIMKKKRG